MAPGTTADLSFQLMKSECGAQLVRNQDNVAIYRRLEPAKLRVSIKNKKPVLRRRQVSATVDRFRPSSLCVPSKVSLLALPLDVR